MSVQIIERAGVLESREGYALAFPETVPCRHEGFMWWTAL